MALSGSFQNFPANNFGLYCEWSAAQSVTGNYSNVTLSVYLKYWSLGVGERADSTISINGTTETYTVPAISDYTDGYKLKLLKTKTVTVYHNADGTKTGVPLSASWRMSGTYSGVTVGTITASTTIDLDSIDRTAPTVKFTVSNITAGGFKISATSSATSDVWQYSTNNGTSWTQFSTTAGTSASYSVSGLSPNTTYNVKVRARKKSNYVYGTSGSTSVKTLGGAVVNSVSDVTADGATVSFVLNVTVYEASYTNTVVLKNGTTTYLTISGLSWTKGTANRTVTLTAAQRTSLLTSMASIKSFTGTFEVTTFNGTTQIGSVSSKTATVTTTAANSGPALSGFTYEDSYSTTYNITGNNQLFIQSYSTLKVTPGTATPKNGASITNYTATCNGVSASNTTGAAITVGKVTKSGDVSVVLTVTDSRGYTASVTKTISVIAYAKPKVSALTIRRTNDIEAEMQLSFNGSISPITVASTQKNALTYVRYRYKLTSATSYGGYTSILSSVTASGTSFSYSNLELCSLDANSSYDFHIQIVDKLATINLYYVIPQGTPLLALRKGNVGINTPTPDAALHVVGDTHIVGDTRIEGTLTPDDIDYAFEKPYFGTCATAAATAAKVVTCADFVLKKGALIAVQFTYANTASSPSMNVNGTGALAICGIDGTYISTNMWVAKQVVHFVYNGTWWVAIGCLPATTARYGLTKLTSSVSSTSTSLAATASAVKSAYDRSSWDSITLTNALALAYGGTGATTASGARTNLGITCTSLYNGTLTTGSTTFNYGNYKAYLIMGQPTSSSARCTFFIPKAQITTTATTYQFADESNYYAFNLSYSSTTVTLAYKSRSSSGQILRIWGVN